MNCQEFWNTMPELADQREPLEQHSKHCAACAARLRSQQTLKAALRAVSGQMSHIGAPVRVESRLRAEFRAHHGTPLHAPVGMHWAPAVTWATAAAVVIGLALFLVRIRQAETPNAPAIEMAMAGTPALIAADAGADSDNTDGDNKAANNGFIALPNAAAIGPNEDVNMVRVEVPRSAMIALGFEVNPEQAWQPVEADVMLGADGLARAVRFLN